MRACASEPLICAPSVAPAIGIKPAAPSRRTLPPCPHPPRRRWWPTPHKLRINDGPLVDGRYVVTERLEDSFAC
eukprot:1076317-Pleurochrysis_carterae.AAC.4